jgi:hypothetical protein
MSCDESKCLPSEFIEFKIDLSTGKEVKDVANAEGPKVQGNLVDHSIPSLQATYENPLSDCGEKLHIKRAIYCGCFYSV